MGRETRRIVMMAAGLLVLGCGSPSTPKEYSSEEGNFRVLIPGRPEVSQRTFQAQAGPLTMHILVSNAPNETTYFVGRTVYPEMVFQAKTPNKILVDAVHGMATSYHWDVKSEEPILFDGHPGRDVRFEVHPARAPEPGFGQSRVLLVGDRLYQLFVIGPKSRLKPETAENFIRSFALLKPVAVVASRPEPPARARETRAQASPTSGQQPRRAAKPEPATSSAGGASIVSFQWSDADDDRVGGHNHPENPDGTKDQHLDLQLDLPPNSTIEALTITSGGFNKWVTKPTPRLWPIAIFRGDEAVNRAHVEQVGTFSGAQDFDLYINSGGGLGPGSPFNVSIDVLIDGEEYTLSSQCKRP